MKISIRSASRVKTRQSATSPASIVPPNRALVNGDVRGVLGSLLPSHPDYAALRAMLSITPASDEAKRDLIRANMDRWRWLPRDLGGIHLLANIPEFMLRLTVDGEVMRTYRTIVGQPGRNATPQLAEHEDQPGVDEDHHQNKNSELDGVPTNFHRISVPNR